MIRKHFPPPTTLLLAGTLILAGTAAPFLLRATDISPLIGETSNRGDTRTTSEQTSYWPGPRPETKREILIKPLFTEDRKLPVPFNMTPPPEEPVAAAKPPEPTPVVTQEDIPPEDPPIEMVSDEIDQTSELEQEEQETKPLVLPELRLLGTFILESKGIARALLIETKEGSEETWVDENGFYEDWILTIVSPEAVRLVGGEESLTLELWYEEEPASDDEQVGQDQQVIGVEGNSTTE